MKKILILFTVLLLCNNAAHSMESNDNGRFCEYYLATKGNQQVYILGTIHSLYVKGALYERIFNDIEKSGVVLTESNQNKFTMVELICNELKGQDLKQLNILSDNFEWVNNIDHELLAPIQELLDPIFNATKKSLGDFKPNFIKYILTKLTFGEYSPPCLDDEIANFGAMAKKPVRRLDQVKDIYWDSYNKYYAENSVGDLNEELAIIKKGNYNYTYFWDDFAKACEKYPNASIEESFYSPLALSEYTVEQMQDSPDKAREVFKRNRLWVSQIISEYCHYNTIFMAGGCGHLLSVPGVPGVIGVLELFNQQGFEIFRYENAEFRILNAYNYTLFEDGAYKLRSTPTEEQKEIINKLKNQDFLISETYRQNSAKI